jgi:uncharacterized protein (TIGR02271 family)
MKSNNMKHAAFNDEGGENHPKHTEGNTENSHEKVIPVIEESVQVDKKWVETGKVHISKKVSEHNEVIDIPLKHEEVNIERVEVNEYVDSLPPAVRYEGETMIIPVLKEVFVKRVMIVEEIRVTRKEVEKHTQQEVTLKKEEIHVNKTSTDQDQLK